MDGDEFMGDGGSTPVQDEPMYYDESQINLDRGKLDEFDGGSDTGSQQGGIRDDDAEYVSDGGEVEREEVEQEIMEEEQSDVGSGDEGPRSPAGSYDGSPPASLEGAISPTESMEGPQSPTGSDVGPQSPTGSDAGPQSPSESYTGPHSPTGSEVGPQSPSGSYIGPQSPVGNTDGPQSPTGSNEVPASPTGSGSRPGSPMELGSLAASPMGSRTGSPAGRARSRSGSPAGSARSRSGSPAGSARSRSGSPAGSRRSRSGSPAGSARSRSGSPAGSARSRSGSPAGSARSRSGSPAGSARSRSGSPAGSTRSRSGSPAGSARSRSGSPAGSARSRSGSPAGSARSRSGSPAGSARSRSGSPAGSARSRSGSPGGSARSRSGSPGGSARSRSGSSARSRSGSPAGSNRSRSGSRSRSRSRSGSPASRRSGTRSRSHSPSGRSRSTSPVDRGSDSEDEGKGPSKKAKGSDDEDDSGKESEVEEMIADIFGSSDEGEEFEGFEEKDVEAANKKKEKKKLYKPILSDDEGEAPATEEQVLPDLSEDENEEAARQSARADFVSDFDLMMMKKKEEMRKRRKKRKDVDIINDSDDLIADMIRQMKEAAEMDRELNRSRKPAIKKLKYLPDVYSQLKKADLQGAFLDCGILGAMTEWLAPLPDKSLPHLQIREKFINVLMEFPSGIQESLKASGIGKAIMYLYKHPKETKQNREKCGKLINEWSRPIFSLTSNYKSMSKEERQKRDYEQLPKKRRISAEGMTPRRDIDNALSGEQKALRPGDKGWIMRARVPMPSNKDYVVRPNWNVESEVIRTKGKKDITRYEKHVRAFNEKKKFQKGQRAVTISIEGRNMAI